MIDDEEVVRRSAQSAALERSGYDIVLAEDGTEGIQLFQAMARQNFPGAARSDNAWP